MRLKLQNDPKNVWLTSDTHFGHYNCAVVFPERKFPTVEEHDQFIIDNWNEVVGKDDLVIHAGDFAFKNSRSANSYLESLNGNKIIINGNHCKSSQYTHQSVKGIYDYLEISIAKEFLVLFHYPILTWNRKHHGSYLFYGHVHHYQAMPDTRSWNLCTSLNDYYPVNLYEIMKKLEEIPFGFDKQPKLVN